MQARQGSAPKTDAAEAVVLVAERYDHHTVPLSGVPVVDANVSVHGEKASQMNVEPASQRLRIFPIQIGLRWVVAERAAYATLAVAVFGFGRAAQG